MKPFQIGFPGPRRAGPRRGRPHAQLGVRLPAAARARRARGSRRRRAGAPRGHPAPGPRELPLRRLPGHLALHEPAGRPAHRVLGARGDRGRGPGAQRDGTGRSPHAIASTRSIRSSSCRSCRARAWRSARSRNGASTAAAAARPARHGAGGGRRGGRPPQGTLAQPGVARGRPARRRPAEARAPAAGRARHGRARRPAARRRAPEGAPRHHRDALGALQGPPPRGGSVQARQGRRAHRALARQRRRRQARRAQDPQGGGRGPHEARSRHARRRRAARPAHRQGGAGHGGGRLHRLGAVPPDRQLPALDAGALRAERVRDVPRRRRAARALPRDAGRERRGRREERAPGDAGDAPVLALDRLPRGRLQARAAHGGAQLLGGRAEQRAAARSSWRAPPSTTA